jgi:nitrate reductase (NAD(P)H)
MACRSLKCCTGLGERDQAKREESEERKLAEKQRQRALVLEAGKNKGRPQTMPMQNEATRDGKIVNGKISLSTTVSPMSLEMPPRQDAEEVDPADADSPDKWIKRHADMVRLTGRHPFNSEPKLESLQKAGWVTPPSLHLVRNHGAVPQLNYDTHRLQISGVPGGGCELSMADITSGKFGPMVSIPVTFICAGNRRKEQNMVKKTIGFNWGCAAVANSVWTGVRLCDVLAALGITKVTEQHRYVHFEGPVGELPQGETGVYGTSIDMGWALDRERDVLLAFKQNGEPLTPDHGAPLRTLLPGCIGGRMIKWLCKMWVSSEPSKSHYHYFDNRVLPPHVDADLATQEGWWFKDEYIINHMNMNSAMFEPRHNSYLKYTGNARTMKVCGYAYVGGGLKIIRAEISLDSGKTWEITDLDRPEDAIAKARGTDKHWCWAWWETEVDVERLKACTEILCRAVDSNQNMQPLFLTWNVMGMLNNCSFRVKVHHLEDGDGVWFEHPTMPGNQAGGWMTQDAGKFDAETAIEAAPGRHGQAPKRPVAASWKYSLDTLADKEMAKSVQAPVIPQRATAPSDVAGKRATSNQDWLKNGITMEEVAKHNSEGSPWIVVKDRVYDCTPYMNEHPGGASSIMLLAGAEATEDFEAVHSSKAWAILEDFFIGPLRKGSIPKVIMDAKTIDPNGTFLNPRQFQKLPLVEKVIVSHDTRIFRFGLPCSTMKLGLPTGMHMFLKGSWKGQTVMRPYTPMTNDSTLGHVDFLIKVYFANTHPKFPDGGKMSQLLESMKIGECIEVKGPMGEFVYKGKGAFTWHNKPRNCSHISMIAGGTGLTPCWQVASSVLADPDDQTKVSLLYANQSPTDILARDKLDDLARKHPQRFKLWYTVDRVPEGQEWTYNVGFVNEDLIKAHVFPPSDGAITVMCGPPIMLEKACTPNLLKFGYKEDDIFAF